MDLIQELNARGFIYQSSDEEGASKVLAEGQQLAYIGFDCTADSLHVGSLVVIMLLRRWQKAGHRPIILLGGATTMVGDPSGKDQSRQLLTTDQIQSNKESLKKVFQSYLDFDCPKTGALMVDNLDWWKDISYLELLRNVGTLMTVNRMMTFETVQRRLEREQPLTFLEFNYMILQGYDFVHLEKTLGCRFQFGGSDQWGNMIAGLELSRKMGLDQCYVLTTPLLTTASGQKMGKTEQGAVWLNADKLSDYDFWQFWRNCDDRDVEKFLKLFTDLTLDEVAKIMECTDQDSLNKAKIILANEQTKLCRGLKAQQECDARAQAIFSTDASLRDQYLPELSMNGADHISLVDFLALNDLAESKGAARKLIRQQGIKINNQTVFDEMMILTVAEIQTQGITLSVGKKKHFKIIM